MMHPDTELRYISEEIGHGVVATRDIPKGTITWVQDKLDREFEPEQVETFGEPYTELLDKYCFRNQHGRWVLCWDHARFVNHSFRSNCLTTAYNFEVAIRDIRAGEELTDDYGYLNIMHPFHAYDEGTERKVVYPDDLTRYHGVWDGNLRDAWPNIPKVAQPLRELLSAVQWKRVGRIASGREMMASILECYFAGGAECSKSTEAATGCIGS
ncbi:MAG: SET domain-containing protein [Phycisphaerales bacterium]|nr:SET domain-containing protein [Phycisphaerales bacterium]